MGTFVIRNSIQGCGFLCYYLGSRKQQLTPSCSLHMSRRIQIADETMLVMELSGGFSSIVFCYENREMIWYWG